jgi:hypothetical protein
VSQPRHHIIDQAAPPLFRISHKGEGIDDDETFDGARAILAVAGDPSPAA